jgi:DNA polymerase III gamma/tau subunit
MSLDATTMAAVQFQAREIEQMKGLIHEALQHLARASQRMAQLDRRIVTLETALDQLFTVLEKNQQSPIRGVNVPDMAKSRAQRRHDAYVEQRAGKKPKPKPQPKPQTSSVLVGTDGEPLSL